MFLKCSDAMQRTGKNLYLFIFIVNNFVIYFYKTHYYACYIIFNTGNKTQSLKCDRRFS